MNSYKTRLKMGAVGILLLASLTACSSMPTNPASSSTPVPPCVSHHVLHEHQR